jgi:hypothetical protein
VARSVQHHFNDAFDISIDSFETRDVHPESSRDGRTDLFYIEVFPLDFAAPEYVLGQSLENSLLTKLEAQIRHASQQTPLLVTDLSQSFRQSLAAPAKPGPIQLIVDM